MAQFLSPFSGRQFLDLNGKPYVGAKLFTYVTGSSTKITTTKDSAGASNHTNPIILNARGEPSDGAGASQVIWQSGGSAVKYVLAPSTDSDPPLSAISTWDNISGINDSAASATDQWVLGQTPSYLNATQFTVAGDQTSIFSVGRRVRSSVTAGTVYGVIVASVFTTLTTITLVMDSTSLDPGLNTVSYGIISGVNTSVPGSVINGNAWRINYAVATGTNTYLSSPGYTALLTGTVYTVLFTNAATSTVPTIKFDALNTITITRPNGTAILLGDIPTGHVGQLLYDGTNNKMLLLNARWLAWEVADVRTSYRTAADYGWLNMLDGSIGNAASGATQRANADTEALFTHLWTACTNIWCPVSTGRGASAAADFAANKNLTLPRTLSRSLGVSGTGSGLSGRSLGEYLGAENHVLTVNEMPIHKHALRGWLSGIGSVPSIQTSTVVGLEIVNGSNANELSTAMDNNGGGASHNNMHPVAYLNVFIKL